MEWGLRDYGAETVRVWGGDPECEHEWAESESGLVHENRNFSRGSQEDVHGEKETTWIRKYDAKKAGFCIKCGAWRGSLGLEPHPQLFIDHLVEICGEIKRVLKPTGTFWLNLGDTYYGSGGKGGQYAKWMRNKGEPKFFKQGAKNRSNWLQPKQLLGMPWRVAIALQDDGWILRNDIIWYKPNHMPSPVKDRLTNAYEHVFLLAKQRRYYFDLDAIRKPQQTREDSKIYDGRPIKWESLQEEKLTKGLSRWKGGNFGVKRELHPKGKNPGDLWRIPTTPFPGAHFATFPPKLIEPIIKAGSPRWICSRCGKPRIRITEPTPAYAEKLGKSVHDHKEDLKRGMRYDTVINAEYTTTGWTDCGCGEKWIPGVVMDPFGGSGTVGQVAHRLGRRFILIEIIPEYCKIAEQRVRGKYKPVAKGVTPFTKERDKQCTD